MKKATFAFGRFNPITLGHAKLVKKVEQLAKKSKADAHIYMSHSEDPKKNPLSYNDKIKFGKKAFGKIVRKSDARTFIQALSELHKEGYTHVEMVAGSDRINEFQKLVDKYNGKNDFDFEKIEVISAGERDESATDVSGMSASKMRKFAAEDNWAEFKKGSPLKSEKDTKDMYNAVRKGLKIAEELEHMPAYKHAEYITLMESYDIKEFEKKYGKSYAFGLMHKLALRKIG